MIAWGTRKSGRTVILGNRSWVTCSSQIGDALKPEIGLVKGLLFDLVEVNFELEMSVGLHVAVVLAMVIAHDIDVLENIHFWEDRVVVFTFFKNKVIFVQVLNSGKTFEIIELLGIWIITWDVS